MNYNSPKNVNEISQNLDKIFIDKFLEGIKQQFGETGPQDINFGALTTWSDNKSGEIKFSSLFENGLLDDIKKSQNISKQFTNFPRVDELAKMNLKRTMKEYDLSFAPEILKRNDSLKVMFVLSDETANTTEIEAGNYTNVVLSSRDLESFTKRII